jgi:hypothetical protein
MCTHHNSNGKPNERAHRRANVCTNHGANN